VISRDGNNLSSTLRDAWDTGKLRTLVKHAPQQATGAHISMVGHITRLELLRYLSDTEQHNGFANRILWCAIKLSKCLPEGGSVPENEMAALAHRLHNVVTWAQRSGEVEIHRDDAARGLWAAVYPRLSEGLPGLLGAATSRAEAQVLRLSAVYAALDCSSTVRVEHLHAALAVWDYCFASAKYIFGEATGDPVADRLSEALQSAGTEGLTRTQISNLFGRHASVQRITQALAQLTALGAATPKMVSTDGRSIELWITHTSHGGRTVKTFSKLAEEWVQKNLPAEVSPQDAPEEPAEKRNPTLEEWREAFALWLEFACVRRSRDFSGLICLYRSFSDWQNKHNDWALSIDTFEALFAEQDFLVGEVFGTKLVSGLAFRDDL